MTPVQVRDRVNCLHGAPAPLRREGYSEGTPRHCSATHTGHIPLWIPMLVTAAERDSYPGSGSWCVHDPGLVTTLLVGERTHTCVTEPCPAVPCLSSGFLDF